MRMTPEGVYLWVFDIEKNEIHQSKWLQPFACQTHAMMQCQQLNIQLGWAGLNMSCVADQLQQLITKYNVHDIH